MDFYKKLNEGLSLDKLVKLQWDLTGEKLLFNPDRVAVRMEDVNGKVFEMVLHKHDIPVWWSQECVILYMILMKQGLLPKGRLWIELDMIATINYAKKNLHHEFVSNAEECILKPWLIPNVRF